MDDLELASLFIKYAACKKEAALLQAEIEVAVLDRGETTKIAGVTASYYKASFGTPDYEGAARQAMPDDFDVSPYTNTTVSVSWKPICEALGVVAPPGEEKPARVVVK